MKIDQLYTVYEGLDTLWIERNRCVFENAVATGLAMAGSIAMSLACKKAKKEPSDIDLVCCSVNDAMAFISSLQTVLMRYQSHWRIYVNHNNDFVPPGCTTHFRFQCGMWMPICIMVIPAEKFQFWFAPGGLRIQRFEFAKDAAKKLEEVDHKDRTSAFDTPREDDLEQGHDDEMPVMHIRFEPEPTTEQPTYRRDP